MWEKEFESNHEEKKTYLVVEKEDFASQVKVEETLVVVSAKKEIEKFW